MADEKREQGLDPGDAAPHDHDPRHAWTSSSIDGSLSRAGRADRVLRSQLALDFAMLGR